MCNKLIILQRTIKDFKYKQKESNAKKINSCIYNYFNAIDWLCFSCT